MAKEQGTLSLVSLDQTLNVNDVLAVVTSRAETRLHAELTVAKKGLKDAEEEVASLTKEASDQYKRECAEAGGKLAEKLRPVIESVGGKVTVSKKEGYVVERRERNDKGQLVCCVSVSAGCGSATFEATVEPSSLLLKLEERLVTAKANVKQRQEAALEIKKRISNVPMLERQARARLAEAKLSESADGRAVLDALTSQFEADFLALPGV